MPGVQEAGVARSQAVQHRDALGELPVLSVGLTEEELATLRVVGSSEEALKLFVVSDKGHAAIAVSPEDGFIRDGAPVASAIAVADLPDAETAKADALAAAKAEVAKAAGKANTKIEAYSCDVSKAQPIADTIKKVVADFGKVDILVNNAGISHAKAFDTVTDEDWQGDLDLKLFAAIRLDLAHQPRTLVVDVRLFGAVDVMHRHAAVVVPDVARVHLRERCPMPDTARSLARPLPLPEETRATGQLPLQNHVSVVVVVTLAVADGVGRFDQVLIGVVAVTDQRLFGAPGTVAKHLVIDPE